MKTEKDSQSPTLEVGDTVIPMFVPIYGKDGGGRQHKITKKTTLTVSNIRNRGGQAKVMFEEINGGFELCYFIKQ